MNKINWKQKLTSRKFWVAVTGLGISIMTLAGTNTDTQTQVTALIMAGASVIAYIVGEGLVDASNTDKKDGE